MSNYYPSISSLISLEDIPDTFGLVNSLNDIFSKVHFKDLQVSHSTNGDAGFYDMVLLNASGTELALDVPGVKDMKLVLNPASGGFPFSCSYQMPVLKYLKDFDLTNFASNGSALYDLLLKVSGVDSKAALKAAIFNFIEDDDPIAKFIHTYNNTHFPSTLLTKSSSTDDDEVIADLVNQLSGTDIFQIIYDDYINSSGNLETAFSNLSVLFNDSMGNFSLDDIKQMMLPNFTANLGLTSLDIVFPKWLFKNINAPSDFSKLHISCDYSVQFDTRNGLEFIEGINPSPTFTFDRSEIANTGFTIAITNAKLDLSRTKNIPEAIADGRPDDFIGVYIQHADVGLPDYFGATNGTSSNIIAKNMLIGTGGVSGTIGFESASGKLKRKFGFIELELDVFEIELKQNKIVGSSISGKMKMPGKLKKSGANHLEDVEIDIDVYIDGEGDFGISAKSSTGLSFSYADMFDFDIRSLGVGKSGSHFYIETSGVLSFRNVSNYNAVLADHLPKKIDIKKLKIWDNGNIEFEGGGITLPGSYKMKLGPVDMSISNLTFGSTRINYKSGSTVINDRPYSFFGFDGSIKVSPGGVEARGDGIKVFFSTDGNNRDIFLKIAGIGVDIRYPADAKSAAEAELLIRGYVSAQDAPSSSLDTPNAEKEYTGSVSFSIKKLRISGSAAMRLNPDRPAFIIDAGIELPTPIPLATTGLGIYGFRGLIAEHYYITKSAAKDVTEEDTWWAYYKSKDNNEGINEKKFAPNTKIPGEYKGFGLGAGVSIATMTDSGKAFSSKIFLYLGLPETFLLQGQAAILKDRIGLLDYDDAPFSLFVGLTSKSFEAAIGVNYLMPEDAENPILNVQGKMEMAFFFNNASGWYINIGKDLPESERIRAEVLKIFNAYAYLMISSQGIKAGAGTSFKFNRDFGPVGVGLYAYFNIGGHINFKPTQIGGFIDAGGSVYIRAFGFKFGLSVSAYLGVDAYKPFIIKGAFHLNIGLPWPFDDIDIELELQWLIDDEKPQIPLTILDTTDNNSIPIAAVNMLSGETFKVSINQTNYNLTTALTDINWYNYIIPLDSFIDIDLKYCTKYSPDNNTQSPENNIQSIKIGADKLITPITTESVPKNQAIAPKVNHSFKITELSILAYNETSSSWIEYDVYKAVTAISSLSSVQTNPSILNNLPAAYWQLSEPDKNTKLRIMSQEPFSYMSQASPGEFNLEYFGFDVQKMICSKPSKTKTCINWENSTLGSSLPSNTLNKLDNVVSFKYNNNTNLAHVIGNSGAIFTFNKGLEYVSKNGSEIFLNEECSQFSIVISVDSIGSTIADPTQLEIYYYNLIEAGTDANGIVKFQYQEITNEKRNVLPGSNSFAIDYDNINAPVKKIVVKGFRSVLDGLPISDPSLVGPINIGRRVAKVYGTAAFDGLIDDVRLYPDFITDSDVNQLYIKTKDSTDPNFDYYWNPISPVGWWQMDSSTGFTVDSSSYGNDGFVVGNASQVTGKFNEAGQFLVSNTQIYNNDGIEIPTSPSLDFREAPYSVFAWVQYHNNNSRAQVIFDKRKWGADNYTANGFALFIWKGKISVQVVSGPIYTNYYSDPIDISTPPNTQVQWLHVGFTLDYWSGKLKVYLNGDLVKMNNGLYEVDIVKYTQNLIEIPQKVRIHSMCYLTLSDGIYNENIATSNQVNQEITDLSNGLTKTIQPVWRPNTKYIIKMTTNDIVNGQENKNHFVFGFQTKGPVGLFHKYKDDNNVVTFLPIYQSLKNEKREDEFKLASLKHYIDFERSVPNPDSSTLYAKPIYWKDVKLKILFLKQYIKAMFSDWTEYNSNGLPTLKYKLKTQIIDPLSGEQVPEPGWIQKDFHHTSIGVNLFNNVIANNGFLCVTDPPFATLNQLGFQFETAPLDLLPSKLYSVIFNSVKLSSQSPFAEEISEKIYQFSFLTSRYESFSKQISSYNLSNTKKAKYPFYIELSSTVINDIKDIIGKSTNISDESQKNFSSPFDRIIEGKLANLNNIQAPVTTDLTVIINSLTNKTIGWLLRSPEPIIDPRINNSLVDNSVEIYLGSTDKSADFKFVYSKDRTQVFITNYIPPSTTNPSATYLDIPSNTYTIKLKLPEFNSSNDTYEFTQNESITV